MVGVPSGDLSFKLLQSVALLLYGIVHIVDGHPGIGLPVFPDAPKPRKGQMVGRDNIALPGRVLEKLSPRCGRGGSIGIEAKGDVGIVDLQSDVDDVSPEHHLFSAVFKNVNGQARSVAVSRLGAESGEELRGAFEGLELSAVHIWLDLRIDLGEESLLRLDRGCGNRFVEPVVDLSFVDVNRGVRKNLRVPIHQAPRMVRMDVSDEHVGNVLRRGPRRAEGLRQFAARRADQFRCASVNQEKVVLVLDQKSVDGGVHRRLFKMPRQETFNLARLGVLNQFLSESETDGSIRNGNYIDLSDLCSVNARLTTIKLRHSRERYDRLVRGLLRIRDDAYDGQSRHHDLRHKSECCDTVSRCQSSLSGSRPIDR